MIRFAGCVRWLSAPNCLWWQAHAASSICSQVTLCQSHVMGTFILLPKIKLRLKIRVHRLAIASGIASIQHLQHSARGQRQVPWYYCWIGGRFQKQQILQAGIGTIDVCYIRSGVKSDDSKAISYGEIRNTESTSHDWIWWERRSGYCTLSRPTRDRTLLGVKMERNWCKL